MQEKMIDDDADDEDEDKDKDEDEGKCRVYTSAGTGEEPGDR